MTATTHQPEARVDPGEPALRARSPLANSLTRVDWLLLGAVAGLLVLGSLLVWSATAHRDVLTGGDPRAFAAVHSRNVVIGVGLMGLVATLTRRWVRSLSALVYGVSLVGLSAVLVAGTTINGSRSWLSVAGFSVQPSEFAKLGVILALALFASARAPRGWRRAPGFSTVVVLLGLAALPAALIALQPDLGTLFVLSATILGVLAAAGVGRRWLVGLSLTGLSGAAAAVAWGVLKDYQVDRFLAFTNPGLDPRGAGYNTEQARIAVGSGGWFGQGLFAGSQTRAGFVPEQHTDFIFTVAGEELGLVGAGLLIVLEAIVVWRALAIAAGSTDAFGRITATGIACWFGFQSFQNIGMCLGIMPVTGVPLPFVSYGGSAMFACLLAVGLLHQIRARSAADHHI